jgi:hypothetical protein
MLSWNKENAHDEPVRIVQAVIVGIVGAGEEGFAVAVEKILEAQLWQRQASKDGQVFTSFAAFAMAPRPAGLGIQSTLALKLLRRALLEGGYFAEWTQLLKLAMRTPGRPRTSQANDEGFNRFYTLSTSRTATDQILLGLEKQFPEEYACVCKGECTPYAAAVNAGLVPKRTAPPQQRFDMEAISKLSEPRKRQLLRDVFKAVGLNAQCTLLSLDVGPWLELDLAGLWKKVRLSGS